MMNAYEEPTPAAKALLVLLRGYQGFRGGPSITLPLRSLLFVLRRRGHRVARR